MSDEQAGPMRLGILQCDFPPEELQPEYGSYADMLQELLSGGLVPLAFRRYDLPRGEFPESIDECDAWLFTGSRWSAYDPDEWVARAKELVRELHTRQRPMIGVCFGHQLIAEALGGRVGKAEAGWGVGVHTAGILEQRPWMEPQRESLPLLVSHQDQVQQPPAGAEVLASHEFCPYDMLQIDGHVLTLQGHPEFRKGFVRGLIEGRRERIGEETAEAGLDSLAQPVEGEVAAAWIHRFLAQARR